MALLSDALFANVAGGAAETLWFGMPAWRWMFLAAAVPAVLYGVCSLRLPESPRYLVARGGSTTPPTCCATSPASPTRPP